MTVIQNCETGLITEITNYGELHKCSEQEYTLSIKTETAFFNNYQAIARHEYCQHKQCA